MRTAIPFALTAALLVSSGCAPDEQEADTLQLLPAREQLIRLSMDLRGVHPSEEELRLYETTDPVAQRLMYDTFAQEWIDDPRFIGRIKEIFNERYLVRTGDVYFDTSDIPELASIDDRRMADNIANEQMMLLDREFHDTLAQAARNTVLAGVLRNLHERSLRFWFISLRDPEHHKTVLAQHRSIVEALRSRQPDTAEEAMREHILSFQRSIMRQA